MTRLAQLREAYEIAEARWVRSELELQNARLYHDLSKEEFDKAKGAWRDEFRRSVVAAS